LTNIALPAMHPVPRLIVSARAVAFDRLLR
jgi:hypothetical protein